jgi:WD40 repeat protein
MSHIFISYSRRDLNFVGKIVQALTESKLDIWVDWKSIPKGEDWEQEIYRGIEEADAFLFFVSPDSVRSEICTREVMHAVNNGKRILPIVIRDVELNSVRAEISKRNWIFCRDGQDDFNKAIRDTHETIHTDYDWLKFHTKLQVEALDWERRKDNSRLLWGKELKEAEQRLAEVGSQVDPQPTDLQRRYALTSRKIADRRRLMVSVLSISAAIIVLVLGIFGSTQARAVRARQLVEGAQAILEERPQLGLLLSVEALNALKPGDQSIPSAEQSLRSALLGSSGIALGQGMSLTAPVISADNHWLAAGTSDGHVKLWDLTAADPTETPLVFSAHKGQIQAITITADNRWLITAGANASIYLWELSDSGPDKNEPVKLSANGCSISILKPSPDNHWLIIICDDDTVMLWDLTKADSTILPVTLKSSDVSSDNGGFDPATGFLIPDRQQLTAVSADSRWLALASGGIVLLWDLEFPDLSAEPIVLNGHKFSVTSLAISPNNRWLATAGFDKTILLWDLTSSDPSSEPIIMTDHFQVSAIIFSPDGLRMVAGNSEGAVRLWDFSLPDPQNSSFDVEGQALFLSSISISPDNRWLVTAGNDVRLLDISSGFTLPPLILVGNESPVITMKVSSNSRWLVTLNMDTSLRIWDLTTPQPSASPITLWSHGEYGNIRAIATSPTENHWLATAGGNGVAISDLTDPDFITTTFFISNEIVNLLAISPDNHWLVADRQDGAALLWDLTNLEENQAPLVLSGHKESISSASFSSDSRWLATAGSDQTVRLWDLSAPDPSKNPMILPGQTGNVPAVSINPNNHWLVAVGSENTQLWDLTAADPTRQVLTLSENAFPIEGAVFSHDNHWLAVGRDDTRLLDLTTADLKVKSNLAGLGIPIAFSPDGNWLVTLKDTVPQLLKLGYRIDTPVPLLGHEAGARITSIKISSDSHWLASGSWDNTARLWDLKAKAPDTTAVVLPSPAKWLPHINILAITPDNHWLIMGVESGPVYLWTLEQKDLISLACQTAGRNLSKDEREQYFNGESRITCPQWPAGQ